MDEAQEKSVNVFSDEAFIRHLIAKYDLPADAKVFCASLDAYYGLDAEFLKEELGDGEGGLGWAFGFEGAMDAVTEFQEKTRIRMPSGWMAIGVNCGKDHPDRYFVENIEAFRSAPDPLAVVKKLTREWKRIADNPSEDPQLAQAAFEVLHEAINAAFEAGIAHAKEAQ